MICIQEIGVGGIERARFVEVPHTYRLEVCDFLVFVLRPAHVEVERRNEAGEQARHVALVVMELIAFVWGMSEWSLS